MRVGRTGVSQILPLRTHTQSPTKNTNKTQNPQKNHKTQNTQKNYKTQNHKKSTKIKNTNKSNTVVQSIPIFSANAAGVFIKIESLVNNVTTLGAGLITIQETHFKRKGRLNDKLPEFEFFESIRNKQKGGTLIGAHKSLDPVLIEEYSENFELLVIEVRIGGKDVRVISGYGPQENWSSEEKMPFFRSLEQEIVKAKLHEKSNIYSNGCKQ